MAPLTRPVVPAEERASNPSRTEKPATTHRNKRPERPREAGMATPMKKNNAATIWSQERKARSGTWARGTRSGASIPTERSVSREAFHSG